MTMQIVTLLLLMALPVALLFMLSRPYLVFVLVVIMFPLEQLLQAYVPFLGSHGTLVNYSIGILALVTVVIRASQSEPNLAGFGNSMTVLTVIFYMLWFIGIYYSPAKEYVQTGLTSSIAYQGLFIGLLPIILLDIYEFRKALMAYMIVGAIMAVLIIVNPRSSYYSGRLLLDLGMMQGSRMATGNPLAIAELGSLVALIAAMLQPARQTQVSKLIRAGVFIIGMGLAIGSGSRGQVLAAGIVGVLLYPVARRVANPKQFILTAVGLGFLAVLMLTTFRLFVGYQNQERWEVFGMIRDMTLRLDMVGQLLDAYVSSPSHWLFGLGTNAYQAISFDQYTGYVHNIAAEALCEHGLVGMAIFIALAVLWGKSSIRLWRIFADDASMRSTVAVLISLGLFSLFVALKQGSLGYPAPFFWWMILARFTKQEEQRLADARAYETSHSTPDEVDSVADGQVAAAY
jgi:hypothetical protein